MNNMSITAISIVFWVFLGVVSIAAIIQDYRKRKLAIGLLRAGIEHGQQLSPDVIDRLLGRDEHPHEVSSRDLHIGGIITCASGIGVAFLAALMALVFPPYHWLVLGVGVLTICVGVGLLLAAQSPRR